MVKNLSTACFDAVAKCQTPMEKEECKVAGVTPMSRKWDPTHTRHWEHRGSNDLFIVMCFSTSAAFASLLQSVPS